MSGVYHIYRTQENCPGGDYLTRVVYNTEDQFIEFAPVDKALPLSLPEANSILKIMLSHQAMKRYDVEIVEGK